MWLIFPFLPGKSSPFLDFFRITTLLLLLLFFFLNNNQIYESAPMLIDYMFVCAIAQEQEPHGLEISDQQV